jgi:hypothetical protein
MLLLTLLGAAASLAVLLVFSQLAGRAKRSAAVTALLFVTLVSLFCHTEHLQTVILLQHRKIFVPRHRYHNQSIPVSGLKVLRTLVSFLNSSMPSTQQNSDRGTCQEAGGHPQRALHRYKFWEPSRSDFHFYFPGKKLVRMSFMRSAKWDVRDHGLGWRTTCRVPRFS